jgi:hypothetical protein
MATYQINANQSATANAAKGTMALWTVSATLRRLKIYEFDVGASAAPASSDCNFNIVLQRMFYTSLVVGTSYTPNPTDPADGAAAATSLVNITVELNANSQSTALPEYNNGMNQRNTIRWVAAQESQFLISAATALNGHYMTVAQPGALYTAGIQTNVYYLE